VNVRATILTEPIRKSINQSVSILSTASILRQM
jgi:hypothetical protein